jgi:hypothetical protein
MLFPCGCTDEHEPFCDVGRYEAEKKQRLKEAIWRIQGICAKAPRFARWRLRQVDAEIGLLANALGVEALK